MYAATRRPYVHSDRRVQPLTLDVTDPVQIQAAAREIDSLDLLINNAGVSLPDDLGGRDPLEHHLAVNLYGTWEVTRALLPALMRSHGTIVNVVSLAALAAVPVLPAYSISKAALFALTQSERALLAANGVTVHAVMAGPIDTDMVRGLEIPKTAPEVVARGVLDGVERARRRSSPTRCPRRWPPAGPRGTSRRSNARTPRWSSRSPSPPSRRAAMNVRPSPHLHPFDCPRSKT